jgi:dihydrofolate reductase
MQIILIAACSRNGVIGANGEIPWRSKEEFKHFKDTTFGHGVVMGRKTWDSIQQKPLKHRINFVMSNQYGYSTEGANVCHSTVECISKAKSVGLTKLFVIGGSELYTLFAEYADEIILSVMHFDAFGDTYWPWYSMYTDSISSYLPKEYTIYNGKPHPEFGVIYAKRLK